MYDKVLEEIKGLIPEAKSNGQYYTANILEKAAAVIEELAERIDGTRWISVEDDLPKDTKPVLAYYGFPGSEEIGLYYQGVLSYYPTDDRPHWQHESSGVTVLYWKPLTVPPKEE